MENTPQDLQQLREEFQECQTLLTALGDETRQYLVCILLDCGCGGIRVTQLAEQTNLSRPSISHHIQILKRAGIVESRREGTQIFYSLAPKSHLVEAALRLFSHIQRIMEGAPDRGAGDNLQRSGRYD